MGKILLKSAKQGLICSFVGLGENKKKKSVNLAIKMTESSATTT